MSEVKYPDVHVRLVGKNGNAFSILGRVRKALTNAGHPKKVLEDFTMEATARDYDHLLVTCMSWVTCDKEEEEDE